MFDSRLYSLLHTGNDGDINYYLQQCKGASSVLELGCGDGRVALVLAKAGFTVTGIDNHKGMIEAGHKNKRQLSLEEQERILFCHDDMRHFQLNKTYDKVIIPFNSILCLLSEKEVISCLKQCSKHLSPMGELIFDVYHIPMNFEEIEEVQNDDYDPLLTLDDQGTAIRVFEKSIAHPDPRRYDTSYRHIYEHPAPAIEYTIEQRCIYAEDLPRILAAAHLELVSITADFSNNPVCDDTDQMVVRAIHASQ